MRSEYRRGILKFGIAAAMIAVAMVCRYLTKTEDLSTGTAEHSGAVAGEEPAVAKRGETAGRKSAN